MLSVIGAAAWLPIIISPIINCFRKVQATVLDLRLLSNGESFSALRGERKSGAILLLALNFYINKVTLYARNISVSVFLTNGAQLTTVLLDYSIITSNSGNGVSTTYTVPIEQEMNISRTIHPSVDNIKYIALLVENAPTLTVEEIQRIEIRLYTNGTRWNVFSKKIVIFAEDFPVYNATQLIQKTESKSAAKESA